MTGIDVSPQPISAQADKVKKLFLKVKIGTIAIGNDDSVALGGTHAIMTGGDVKVWSIQPGEKEIDLNKFWVLGSNPAAALQVLAWD
jgi:hypothetical protein